MKVEITHVQLEAIIKMKQEMESMIGGTSTDADLAKTVRTIDRFLKKNGYTQYTSRANPAVSKF